MPARFRHLLAPLVVCAVLGATAGAAPAAAAGTAQSSVIDGEPTAIGSLPSLIFIRHVAPLFVQPSAFVSIEVCTGTLVAPRVVLTAAHCIESGRGGVAAAAGYNVASRASNHFEAAKKDRARVRRALIFPHYNAGRGRFDAGLLILSKPLSAPLIRLAGPADGDLLAKGTPLIVAGWGYTRLGSERSPPVLRSATTKILGPDRCRRGSKKFGIDFSPAAQLCAIAPHQSTCHGDSGGPGMVRGEDGSLTEVGIIDLGVGNCDPRLPEVLVRADRVSAWVSDWIEATEAGGPEPALRASPRRKPPRMTIPKFARFGRVFLTSNFGRNFRDDERAHLQRCEPLAKPAMKCHLSWFRRGAYFHGPMTMFYGRNSEGFFVSGTYRIRRVDERCWFRSGHRGRCPTSLRRFP